MSHSLTCPFSCLPAWLPACPPPVPGSSSSSAVVLCRRRRRRCRPMSLITLYVIIAHQLLRRPYSLHPAPGQAFHSISFSHIAAELKRTCRDTFCSLIISSESPAALTVVKLFYNGLDPAFIRPFASTCSNAQRFIYL